MLSSETKYCQSNNNVYYKYYFVISFGNITYFISKSMCTLSLGRWKNVSRPCVAYVKHTRYISFFSTVFSQHALCEEQHTGYFATLLTKITISKIYSLFAMILYLLGYCDIVSYYRITLILVEILRMYNHEKCISNYK